MYKKTFGFSLFIALSLLIFVGCTSSSSGELKDGSYTAEFKDADSHGWIEFVELKVENEKIIEVNFDAKDAAGQLKSESAEYKDAMINAGSKTWPSDFYPKLEDSLIDAQDIDKVDAVAGATQSSDAFKKLVKELSKNMSKGDTSTLKVSE